MWKYFSFNFLIAPILALTLLSCAPKPQNDCGFVQNVYGERISWKGSLPITIYFHESVPSEYMAAIEKAGRTWEEALGKRLFNIVTNQIITGPINPQKDGKNVIYYLQNWEANKSSEQARTSIYWIGDQLKEADMRINAQNFKYYWNQPGVASEELPNAVNIEALVIHELGHVLGLKHKDQDSSVMATYLANNTDRTTISESDRSALRCEY